MSPVEQCETVSPGGSGTVSPGSRVQSRALAELSLAFGGARRDGKHRFAKMKTKDHMTAADVAVSQGYESVSSGVALLFSCWVRVCDGERWSSV
eukprot:3711960-Rhodomonas_salina.1